MRKLYFFIAVLVSVSSCVPPGKLIEAVDANTKLETQYDSLYQSHKDTIATMTKSMNVLKDTVHQLNDSVRFYQSIALKPVELTKGDLLYNQIIKTGLLSEAALNAITTKWEVEPSNAMNWLEQLKTDVKTITGSSADLKTNKGFIYIDVSTKLLFNSGKKTLSPKANLTLLQIAKLLNKNPNVEVMIEGHTDNQSFKKKAKLDNWDLSVQRATSVVRLMQTKYKVNPNRIIAAGRSEFMPLDDNKTAAGRANNRYIRIVLMPSIDQLLSN